MSKDRSDPEPAYLGDGVYAERDKADPLQIWIWTERAAGRHSVALDPTAFRALQRFVARAWPGLS